jgi:hypothetical protein
VLGVPIPALLASEALHQAKGREASTLISHTDTDNIRRKSYPNFNLERSIRRPSQYPSERLLSLFVIDSILLVHGIRLDLDPLLGFLGVSPGIAALHNLQH